MTLWEREQARRLARKSLLRAFDDEDVRPRSYCDAVAKSALEAQKRGNLALWVEVCLAVAQELSASLAVTHSLLARARQRSTESEHEGLLRPEVREHVYGSD